MMNGLFRDLELINGGALVAMIWIVQILHYPSFAYYDKAHFSEAMDFHQRRITYIVLPLMFTELGMSLYLFATEMTLINTASLACVLIIWASTFFIQVPIHTKLKTYDKKLIQSLVRGNMIRTVLWTVKLILIEQDKLKGMFL